MLLALVLVLVLDPAAAGAGDRDEGPAAGTPVTRLNETMFVVPARSWCIRGKNSKRSTISSVYACKWEGNRCQSSRGVRRERGSAPHNFLACSDVSSCGPSAGILNTSCTLPLLSHSSSPSVTGTCSVSTPSGGRTNSRTASSLYCLTSLIDSGYKPSGRTRKTGDVRVVFILDARRYQGRIEKVIILP